MIRFKCPGCGHQLKAGPDAAGKKAKCKRCSTLIKIPAAVSGLPPSASTSFHEQPSAPTASADVVAKPSAFDDLPSFETPPAPVAPAQDPFAAAGATQPANNAPAHSIDDIDLGQVLESASSTINQAVQQQKQREAYEVGAKLTAVQVKKCFGQQIDPIERTEGYSRSVKSVAKTMVILPVVSVLVIVFGTVLMGWIFVGWMGRDKAEPITNPIYAFGFMLIAGVLVAAWIPVFHMIRGAWSMLFSGKEPCPGTLTLSSKEQPILHAFVNEICERLGAPKPKRIDVNCEYNASASFDQGLVGLKQGEYVLTLGVPLIASHSADQLASVIAHEFGHFCQKGGMRTSFMARNLSGWFIDSAYEKTIRDEVAAYIISNSEHGAGVFWALTYMINWLGRQMMWGFGYACHCISSVLTREMEYDADRFAVHLAGSKAFNESMQAVSMHAVAYSVTVDNLKMLFGYGVLVDNIPRFMMHVAKTMPATVIKEIAQETEEEKQNRYDTHPPTRDRIKASSDLAKDGIVRVGRPASHLFDHWVDLCKLITLHFYTEVIGEKITSENVTPLEDVLAAEHKLLLDKT